jgi:hypothetical protein
MRNLAELFVVAQTSVCGISSCWDKTHRLKSVLPEIATQVCYSPQLFFERRGPG